MNANLMHCLLKNFWIFTIFFPFSLAYTYSQVEITLEVENTSFDVGEVIHVEALISSEYELSAIQLFLRYDPTYLRPSNNSGTNVLEESVNPDLSSLTQLIHLEEFNYPDNNVIGLATGNLDKTATGNFKIASFSFVAEQNTPEIGTLISIFNDQESLQTKIIGLPIENPFLGFRELPYIYNELSIFIREENQDQCPDDPLKTDPGECGCGVLDADIDGDGVLDCVDNCPDIPNPDQELPRFYADIDEDGFGDGSFLDSCSAKEGYFSIERLVSPTGDCNDTDNTIYPGASEILNDGIDQDCNGQDSVFLDNPPHDTLECPSIIFTEELINSYNQGQDKGQARVSDNGKTILVENNGWKAYEYPYTLTQNTILEFDFKSTQQGELHEIGFDSDLRLRGAIRFQLYGTQSVNDNIKDFKSYIGSGEYQHFRIPIGEFQTGAIEYLLFISDHDQGSKDGNSFFSNVTIHEGDCSEEETDDEAPTTPTGLIAIDVTTQMIELSWNPSFDNQSGIQGYHIYVDDPLIPYLSTGIEPSGIISGLSPGTDYSIFVTAFDNAGNESNPSQTLRVKTLENSISQCYMIRFDDNLIRPYGGGQDKGVFSVEEDGNLLKIENNAWKAYSFSYLLTENSILEFDFKSSIQGELHEIGVDSDLRIRDATRFQLYGNQTVGDNIQDYRTYLGDGNFHKYRIPIGEYRTGEISYLLFITDHDEGNSNGNSFFRNVILYEKDCHIDSAFSSITNFSGNSSVENFPSNNSTLRDNQKIGLFLYPNPFLGKSTILVTGKPNQNGQLLISNSLGQIILKRNVISGEQIQFGSNLAQGFYQVMLVSGTEVVQKKVIKYR